MTFETGVQADGLFTDVRAQPWLTSVLPPETKTTGLKSCQGLTMHFIGSAILYYARVANGHARGSKEIDLNLILII